MLLLWLLLHFLSPELLTSFQSLPFHPPYSHIISFLGKFLPFNTFLDQNLYAKMSSCSVMFSPLFHVTLVTFSLFVTIWPKN